MLELLALFLCFSSASTEPKTASGEQNISELMFSISSVSLLLKKLPTNFESKLQELLIMGQ